MISHVIENTSIKILHHPVSELDASKEKMESWTDRQTDGRTDGAQCLVLPYEAGHNKASGPVIAVKAYYHRRRFVISGRCWS